MNPSQLLKKHFAVNPVTFDIVLAHSRMVADKALLIAGRQQTAVDLKFVEEAALLHDIGISRIHAPKIGCHGAAPYICHGVLGREILEAEGFPSHALVCERHVGVGITVEDIVLQNLDMPRRDMTPVTREEKIICFADLFYSKKPGFLEREKSVDQVKENLAKHGMKKVAIFEKWLEEFGH